MSAFPDDNFAASRFAGLLFERKQYREADSIADHQLSADPSFYSALLLKASMKRERLQLDSSHDYIRRMLDANHQDVLALSSKVRTLLKEKKDAEALTLAKEAVALDGEEAYARVSLVLAYHFNNDARARDALLQKLAGDSSATGMVSYAKDIISGKEFFRK